MADNEMLFYLFDCIKNDNVGEVGRLISENLDPNYSFEEIPPGNLCFGILPIPYLNVACSYGSIQTVDWLLSNGSDPGLVDGNENTALLAAACSGIPQIGIMLLEHGSTINETNATGLNALHIAAQYGKTEFCRFLTQIAGPDAYLMVNAKEENSQTPLFYAAFKNHLETCQFLLGCGANTTISDIESNSPIHVAIQNGAISIAEYLLNNSYFPINTPNLNRRTVLLEAALTGNFELFQLIAEKNANPYVRDIDDNNVLILAAISRNYFIIDYILQRGGINVNAHNRFGYTALHYAAAYGPAINVKRLLDAGCNVNASALGGCPIHLAVKHQHSDIVRQLISHPNFDWTTTAPGFLTPLHLAARTPNAELMSVLLNTNNYDPNIPDSIGWSALHYAASKGSITTMRLLIDAGGNPYNADNSGRNIFDILTARGARNIAQYLAESVPTAV